MFKAFVIAGLSLSSLVLSSFAHANWQLDNDKSQISFVSIKKDSIAEAHHFKRITGELSDEGALTINIDLTSGETLIPIRNERLSKLLFETAQFPSATLTANLKSTLDGFKKPGQYVVKGIHSELDFHGNKKALSIDVLVTKTSDGDLSVSSFTPVVINSNDFGVTEGIKTLQKLAGLPSIATAVPVTFALSFNK
ncbi:YceI family protein [Pseudoalteromonas sp. MMG010]|uniref:YceI family protein n=1 Tax=Pseudoalteromonas sp. MMG010 TaxID=2822685 RepID=UPI001B39D2C7|nr:YceI family protein [Pseudoalteromonas sp. MMG010]MBQ4834190.1 YceI family protein [Pseudoalteromonas sp. MMG010]